MNTASDAQRNGLKAFLNGDFEKAERVYKQGLAAGAANSSAVRETGELLHGLGKLYATLAQYEKSEDCYSKAKTQLENVLGVDHPRIAVTIREMAQLSWQTGHQDQCNTLNRRAVELWRDFLVGSAERLPEEMPTLEALFALRQAKEGIENVHKMARSHSHEQALCGIPFAVAAMLELGMLYRSVGNFLSAKQFLALAVEECAVCDAGPLVQSEATRQLATTLRLLGNTQESDTLFRQALSIYRQLELDEHPYQAEIYFELAQNAETRGDLDEAERLYSASLGITERLLGAQHPQVAQALRRIASVHAAKGQVAAAEVEYKRAVDLLQQAFGPAHRDIAEIWDELGRMYQVQRKYDEAEALYFRAIEIAGASQGPQPPQVAIYYDRLAEVYRHHGRFRKAETAHQRALGIRREAFISTHEEVSATLVRLAKLYLDWGKFADADAYFRSALALLKVGHGETSEQTAACLVSIGITGRHLAKFKDAESALQQAIEIYEQISPDSESDASLIEPLICLGQIASDLGRFKQAKSRYDHAEEIINVVAGESSKRAILLWKLQADLALTQAHLEAAEQLYRKVVNAIGSHHEKEPIALVESYCALGKIESGRGNSAVATQLFDAAMRVATSLPEGDAAAIVSIFLAMAEHSLRQRVQHDAMSYYKQALQQAERSCGPHHILTAKCNISVAEYYADGEQAGQAIEHYLNALQVLETTLGAFHPELATALISLAKLWLKLDKPDNAETLLKRALDIRERVLGSQNPDTLRALAFLADLYMRRGLTAEAKSAVDRIKLIWQENLTLAKPTPVELLSVLIRSYADTNRLDEALALAEKELELRNSLGAPAQETMPLLLIIAEQKNKIS
jgi:tetratricopeptide (TPR) repeat protein